MLTLFAVSSSVYGKPVLPASGAQQSAGSNNTALNSGLYGSDGSEAGNNAPSTGEGVGGETIERSTPRPLSPTKLLPFLTNPHRNPSDADLEALRRRLHNAPRPLKKRSSITEPEGPGGPNIQKLLYQKTTLAAMETIPMETVSPAGSHVQPTDPEERPCGTDVTSRCLDDSAADFSQQSAESPEESVTPPPLPPRLPIPDTTSSRSLIPPQEVKEEEEECSSTARHERFMDEFPPYPPPPYPSYGEAEQGEDTLNLQPPEITGQVTVPPVSIKVGIHAPRFGSPKISNEKQLKVFFHRSPSALSCRVRSLSSAKAAQSGSTVVCGSSSTLWPCC